MKNSTSGPKNTTVNYKIVKMVYLVNTVLKRLTAYL